MYTVEDREDKDRENPVIDEFFTFESTERYAREWAAQFGHCTIHDGEGKQVMAIDNMSEAKSLIDRLTAQGYFQNDLRIDNPPGCTCTREETATPGLMQFVWDENCPIHKVK